MKRPVFSALVISLLSGGCGVREIRWEDVRIAEVRALDAEFEVLGTLADGRTIKALTAALARAERLPDPASPHSWTHKIDIVGEKRVAGRWLYDVATGDLRRLEIAQSTVFRLDDNDRRTFEARLKIEATPASI